MDEQRSVTCEACGWQFHVDPKAIKAECLNPECRKAVVVERKTIDARRGGAGES